MTKEFVQILILQKYVIGNCSLDPWSVFPASTPQFQAFSQGGVGGAWMEFYVFKAEAETSYEILAKLQLGLVWQRATNA